MKRITGLVALVVLIHGALGLWLMRAARVGAGSNELPSTTVVDLRPIDSSDSAESRPTRAERVRARIAAQTVQARSSTEAEQTPPALPDGPNPGSEAVASMAPPMDLTDTVALRTAAIPSAEVPSAEAPDVEVPSAEAPSAAEPTPPIAPSAAPASVVASEQNWPELAEGRSVRRLRVYLGDYTAAQPVARMQLELEVTPPLYRVRSLGEAEGLIALFYSGTLTQESRGRLGPRGLLPEQYLETRGARRQRIVRFDSQAAQLQPADAPAVVLPEGTQDRLSVLYQLGLMAKAQPGRFVAGATIDIPVASFREVRVERFEVVGDEVLIVNDRSWRTLHLKRPLIQAGRDPSIQVWLGYDAALQPIRIRLEDARGQVLDQVIDEP